MKESQEISYRKFRKLFKLFYDTFIDVSIQNPQNVPEDGPFIVVANHRSDIDPFLLISNIKRPINWLGASYLWNIPLAGLFFDSIGAIPISKYQSEIRMGFDAAVEALEDGQGVGIFPEGWDYIAENQFDWNVGRFQTGFARIALKANSPVVPVAMMGLDEIRMRQPFPPFLRKLFDYPFEMQYIKDRCVYKKVHINVGKPIPCPENADIDNHKDLREFADLVHDSVVDLYNAIPKEFGNIEPHTAVVPEPEPDEDDNSTDNPDEEINAE
ncbi:MAG TPA: lysophospholipid acyltransferase family protein [bacterium]|nr:lysophospholipid acyltransferase family protein [bacterium]